MAAFLIVAAKVFVLSTVAAIALTRRWSRASWPS
jgi:hypothetical protein